MSAEEKTTWGEVCTQVGMSDNLYRTCRDKLGRDFKPADPLGLYDYDDADEFEEDFDKQLRKKALPIPKPPKASKKKEPEAEGLMGRILHGDLGGKIAIWGGAAILGAVLVKRFVIDAPKAKAA